MRDPTTAYPLKVVRTAELTHDLLSSPVSKQAEELRIMQRWQHCHYLIVSPIRSIT
ncbi:hypothetical protein AERO9A_340161 [Aeromonas salmonicida]|nr:hypothetical protein AERO9A_340161 [Aeromonas salmonicida]